ncbi:mannose-1-phosphate guanylyltransferase [Butyricicoccus sp.]|uniref:mannose-1-phosphate guanylyltransferase n=1 Tax=Butyricicoccus sp. TaxID=2049021 RepID=UPI0037368C76
MYRVMYLELKSGYHDDGPAWIGKVKLSKSGQTIYFHDHAFQKYNGASGNYIDIETGEEYWISGVKKNGEDRHWAGHGKITIDRSVVDEYLSITGEPAVDRSRLQVGDIEEAYPVERIQKLLNQL